jgi:D-serine deaminase-like pyridoxal phosphate-dependent protein
MKIKSGKMEPTLLDDLPTPCVLVERSRLEGNLNAMQARADANGVALRPHTKTHKSIALAQMQAERGARGLTVAKVGEAEVYADAGFDDIRLAYEIVGRDKHERLLALMDRARISFCVDTPEGAQAASDFYAAHGRRAEVLVEIDCDYGRTGVSWDDPDSIAFVRHVAGLPGLQFAGILTHAGQSYRGPEAGETHADALRRVSNDERDHMLHVASALRAAGFSGFEVSIGSTPSIRYFENREQDGCRITEIRPGNYVFHDATQVSLGSAAWADCALTVCATVISKHRDRSGQERLFVDAGRKVLTSDGGYGTDGYGRILYNARTMTPLPHAHITGLSEEHGWVRVSGGATLAVGDRVRIVPNHACVVVNTQPLLHLVDGQDVVGRLTVDAQGRVR